MNSHNLAIISLSGIESFHEVNEWDLHPLPPWIFAFSVANFLNGGSSGIWHSKMKSNHDKKSFLN